MATMAQDVMEIITVAPSVPIAQRLLQRWA
jgi:hypothetical protein